MPGRMSVLAPKGDRRARSAHGDASRIGPKPGGQAEIQFIGAQLDALRRTEMDRGKPAFAEHQHVSLYREGQNKEIGANVQLLSLLTPTGC